MSKPTDDQKEFYALLKILQHMQGIDKLKGEVLNKAKLELSDKILKFSPDAAVLDCNCIKEYIKSTYSEEKLVEFTEEIEKQTKKGYYEQGIAETIPLISLPSALKDRKPKEWLIKGLIPKKGIVYIGGPPKCFKSTLAFHLALCFVTNRDFLEHFNITKKCKVLFIQEENDEDMLDKMSLLSKGLLLNEEEIVDLDNIQLSLCNMVTIDTFGNNAEMAISRLNNMIEQAKPDVIFFDSAVRMMEGDENSASDVRKVHSTLKSIMKDREIACILLHHTTKKEGTLRGSGDFIAQADTVIMLNTLPKYNGLVIAKIPFNRGAPGKFNEFSFKVWSEDEDKERCYDVDKIDIMKVGEFSEGDATIGSVDEREVWEYIKAHYVGSFSSTDIFEAKTWEFSKRKLNRILAKFVDDGKLSTNGKARATRYEIIPEIQEELVE